MKYPSGEWIGKYVCLCPFLLFTAPGPGVAQEKAQWLTSTQVTTQDGFATLRWTVDGGEAVSLFRLREEHSGERQVTYTDQPEMQVKKGEPGNYSFWVQACKRYADGYPLCGEPSRRLTLSVADGKVGLLSGPQNAGNPSEAAGNR